ncbi:Serine protease, subtilisin family [Micromonospora pattaloongensis]|uniref:Serine protease, subtilisin family n=1 Tax=Micromonospora pattaloongensis TaxID=405436 RepID=A0A1H3HZW3_9ACTN|nr:S8 family peptidase [Micromonospora pattaloongensis]SDY20745.1 Serine protease, subtilisin family [Micromonospora pattaloongensis]
MTIPRRSAVVGAVASAMLAAAAVPAAAAPAEGAILNVGGDTAIADSYIVVFKDNSVSRGGVAAAARDLAGRHGGRLGHTYSAALRGFEVRLDATRAARIAANPAVAYVQQNHTVTIQGTQPNPPSWGLDRIDQRNLPLNNSYTYPSTADTVRAYVIDTGINFAHNDFGGRATSGFDAVDGGSADDCNGHGTHVAGTVGGASYGVAKGVRLVGVRVLNCQGSGTTAQVVAGIDWVTANAVKPAVANMSLGGSADTAIDNAVANSINSGITYAIAAGNGNILGVRQNACNTSPARVPAAVTVGATQNNDAAASFSNYGTCVDILAPGVDITSAWHTNNTATNTISGTSMASPHVAGAAALVLAANPSWTPQQVRDELVGKATPNVVTNPGSGTPNRLLYVGDGGTEPPPPPPPIGCSGSNGTDVPIPDAGAAVTSAISIAGCGRAASASATVAVNIRHTFRGDLVIDLLAPDGSAYRLKNSSFLDGADNVNATYTVNVSGEAADGTWRLQVRDVYSGDTGFVDTWTLTV